MGLNANAVVGDEIFFFGGANIWNNYHTTTVDKYNPVTNAWQTGVATYPMPVSNVGTVAHDGQIYLFGGNNYNGPSYQAAYRFDPVAATFTPLASMPLGRIATKPFVKDGKIWVMGGASYPFPIHVSTDIYDPSTNSWSSGPSLPRADRLALWTGLLSDGRVYVVYSATPNLRPAIYQLNEASGAWTLLCEAPLFQDSFAVAVFDNQIYTLVGGDPKVATVQRATITPLVTPPVLSQPSDISATEGQTVFTSGSYSDNGSGDSVVLTASIGVITKTGIDSGSWTWTLDATDGPAQHTVTITARDTGGASTSVTFQVSVANVSPAIALDLAADSVSEGGALVLRGFLADPGINDTQQVAISWGDGTSSIVDLAASTRTFSLAHTYADDNPSNTPSDAYTISVSVTDKDGGSGTNSRTVVVNNLAPAFAAPTGPADPLAVNATASVAASFSDAGVLDGHTCSISWGDGSTSAPAPSGWACSGSHNYSAAGVYAVAFTVTDDDTGSANTTFQYVVVYDPSAGFVTGSGWINSPAGAYAADLALSGRANFWFQSMYQRGANVPSGSTQFRFQAGNFSFQSSTYDWLVVAGTRAQFKGSGTINGSGGYTFLLTAVDGQQPGGGLDRFRIKIVDQTSGNVVYDNNRGAADDLDGASLTGIAGGNIVVHNR